MTVSTTARSISYTANGGTTVFAYNFKIDAAADLKVYLNGVLQASGYSVSGVRSGSGGNVTFTSAPANGVTVAFIRETSLTQAVDIANNETVYEDAFEVPLDKAMMALQDADARLDTLEATVASAVVVAGNVPSPVLADVGKWLRATGTAAWGWVTLTITNAEITDNTISGNKLTDATLVFAKLATAAVGTVAEIYAKTASKLMSVAAFWSAQNLVSLTDAATVAVDMNTGINFTLLTTSGVGATRQLGNPTNTTVGQSGVIYVIQDATGGRALTFGTNYKFQGGVAPTLTATANAVDRLTYFVRSSTHIDIDISRARA